MKNKIINGVIELVNDYNSNENVDYGMVEGATYLAVHLGVNIVLVIDENLISSIEIDGKPIYSNSYGRFNYLEER